MTPDDFADLGMHTIGMRLMIKEACRNFLKGIFKMNNTRLIKNIIYKIFVSLFPFEIKGLPCLILKTLEARVFFLSKWKGPGLPFRGNIFSTQMKKGKKISKLNQDLGENCII